MFAFEKNVRRKALEKPYTAQHHIDLINTMIQWTNLAQLFAKACPSSL